MGASTLCQAVDVSLVGARIHQIEPPLRKGQSVQLEFEPPNHEPFRIAGSVVRVIDEDGTVGVRFESVAQVHVRSLLYVMSDEKRRTPRTAIELPVFVQRGRARMLTTARDLSRGGIRFDVPADVVLNPLDVVIVELEIEVDEQVHTFQLGTKILREHGDHSVSGEFLAVSDQAAGLIDLYVTEQGWVIY